MASRYGIRPSPNETKMILQEQMHERRKMRLLQVRQQGQVIAKNVRENVEGRRNMVLQDIASQLNQTHEATRQNLVAQLKKEYSVGLNGVGKAQKEATENCPEQMLYEAIFLEQKKIAKRRYGNAISQLHFAKCLEEKQKTINANQKQLVAQKEKLRAKHIAMLPKRDSSSNEYDSEKEYQYSNRGKVYWHLHDNVKETGNTKHLNQANPFDRAKAAYTSAKTIGGAKWYDNANLHGGAKAFDSAKEYQNVTLPFRTRKHRNVAHSITKTHNNAYAPIHHGVKVHDCSLKRTKERLHKEEDEDSSRATVSSHHGSIVVERATPAEGNAFVDARAAASREEETLLEEEQKKTWTESAQQDRAHFRYLAALRQTRMHNEYLSLENDLKRLQKKDALRRRASVTCVQATPALNISLDDLMA